MQLKYKVIRIPVSENEKRARAMFYMKQTGRRINVEKFVQKEIFEEYVEMKCLNCGYEETFPLDMLEELMEMYDTDYPEEECPKCEHRMVPIDLYRTFKKIKRH